MDKKLAAAIWYKVKGTKLPEDFTTKDYKWVIKKYWHRAMG